MPQLFDSSMATELQYISDFIDREQELQLCIDSILRSQKVLILGERGVGKTALVKRVEKEIKEKHENTLSVYFRFTPSMFKHSYIFEIMNCFIHYIWKDILGNNPSDLYCDDSIIQNELSHKVMRMHQLISAESYSTREAYIKTLSGSFVVQGGIQKTNESETSFHHLTSQELNSLFAELSQDLIKFTDAEHLVLLIDEANILDEKAQYEIERELSNLFSLLPFSLVYVASLPIIKGKYSLHTESFEQVVFLEGFNNVKYSKKLLLSRISDKKLVSIEEEVFTMLHNAAKGNPRILIEIMRQICDKQTKRGASRLAIKSQDAKDACDDYNMLQEFEKRQLQTFIQDIH